MGTPEDPHKDGTDSKVKAPPAVVSIGDLAGPESALYDADQDVYFISNINGGLLDRDNNGFISRVDAKTMKVNLQWIAGGRNNVTLDGPKGIAIVGDMLYVSDVTAVRKFNRKTGEAQGEIALPGATLINDLATDGHNVFVSDTGVMAGPGQSFKPTNTDAIWEITDDQPKKIASGTDLEQPNGLDVVDGKLWVVTFGGNELYELDGGKKTRVTKLPNRQLDGLVHLDDGSFRRVELVRVRGLSRQSRRRLQAHSRIHQHSRGPRLRHQTPPAARPELHGQSCDTPSGEMRNR